MLILTVLFACDMGSSRPDDDTGADTGMVDASDAPGGQEGEELMGDTGNVDTYGTDSEALSASSSEVTFKTLLIGCSTEESLTITNDSDAPVSFDGVVSDSSEELSLSTQALPLVLAPGEHTTLAVRYAPLRAGGFTSTLSLYTSQGLDAQIGVDGQGELFDEGADAFVAADDALRFNLSRIPVSGTLSVTIDGTPLAASEWSYTKEGQQLTLANPPPNGAAISVGYAVQPATCD